MKASEKIEILKTKLEEAFSDRKHASTMISKLSTGIVREQTRHLETINVLNAERSAFVAYEKKKFDKSWGLLRSLMKARKTILRGLARKYGLGVGDGEMLLTLNASPNFSILDFSHSCDKETLNLLGNELHIQKPFHLFGGVHGNVTKLSYRLSTDVYDHKYSIHYHEHVPYTAPGYYILSIHGTSLAEIAKRETYILDNTRYVTSAIQKMRCRCGRFIDNEIYFGGKYRFKGTCTHGKRRQ